MQFFAGCLSVYKFCFLCYNISQASFFRQMPPFWCGIVVSKKGEEEDIMPNNSENDRTSPKKERYGVDELYRFLLWICVLFALLRLLSRNAFWGWFWLGGVVFAVLLMGFRVFSTNLPARRSENRLYLRLRKKVFKELRLLVARVRDRKYYAYRKCPECGAVLRLRRKRGEHSLTCPRCEEKFDVHIK